MIWAYSFRGVHPSLQGVHGRAKFTEWLPASKERDGGEREVGMEGKGGEGGRESTHIAALMACSSLEACGMMPPTSRVDPLP